MLFHFGVMALSCSKAPFPNSLLVNLIADKLEINCHKPGSNYALHYISKLMIIKDFLGVCQLLLNFFDEMFEHI